MAAPIQKTFTLGTVVDSAWLNRIQEVEAPLAWNMGLQISGTSVVLPAGTGDKISAVVINGKMRYVEAPLSVSFVGQGAGPYGLWVTTGADDAINTFSLVAVAGASPPGVTNYRQIGSVSWSGTVLSALTLLAGYFSHGALHGGGGSDALPAGSITTSQLADNIITTAKILDAQVTAAKLAPGVTGTLALADGSVTTIKIADGAVTSAKIADLSIVNADVNAAAGIVYSKLNLTNGISNADVNSAAGITYSKLNLGGSIVNADINAAAAIAKSKLAALAIVNADVASGAAIQYSKLSLSNSIVAGDLAADSVTSAKIAASAVGAGELATKAVTGVKLADDLRNQWVVAGIVSFDNGLAMGSPGSWVNFTTYMLLNIPDLPSGLTRNWRLDWAWGTPSSSSFTIQIRDAFRTSFNGSQSVGSTGIHSSWTASGGSDTYGGLNGEPTLFQYQITGTGCLLYTVMLRYQYI